MNSEKTNTRGLIIFVAIVVISALISFVYNKTIGPKIEKKFLNSLISVTQDSNQKKELEEILSTINGDEEKEDNSSSNSGFSFDIFDSNKPSKDLPGYYELVEMVSDGEVSSEEDLKALQALGLSVYLEINEEYTATLSIFGAGIDMEVKDDNIMIPINPEDLDVEEITEENYVHYTFDGDKIVLTEEGETLTFRRAEKPAETDYSSLEDQLNNLDFNTLYTEE